MRGLLKKLKKLLLILFIGHLAYLLWCWVLPPAITLTQVGSLLRGEGLQRSYRSIKNISPQTRLAVMASEDQLFATHSGFDWKSIEKALSHNEKKPKRVRGASTISQQVAKNVFLWQGRSWVRKGLEVYFTFMIELLYSKKRILELYLNVAQSGKGMYGMEAAAKKYFNKPAAALTRSEAAQIAASLPNPALYTVKPMSRWVQYRYPNIMRQMNNLQSDPEVKKLLE